MFGPNSRFAQIKDAFEKMRAERVTGDVVLVVSMNQGGITGVKLWRSMKEFDSEIKEPKLSGAVSG